MNGQRNEISLQRPFQGDNAINLSHCIIQLDKMIHVCLVIFISFHYPNLMNIY